MGQVRYSDEQSLIILLRIRDAIASSRGRMKTATNATFLGRVSSARFSNTSIAHIPPPRRIDQHFPQQTGGLDIPDRSTLTLRSPLSLRASAALRVCHGSMTRAYATAYAPPLSAATERTTGNERGLCRFFVSDAHGWAEIWRVP
jgi:hypothetical protein